MPVAGMDGSVRTESGAAHDKDAGANGQAPDVLMADIVARDGAGDLPPKDASGPDLSEANRSVDVNQTKDSTCNLTGVATANTPTVYVVGDSTASVYASNLYPRMGWAQPLQDFFAPACATVSDKALSGRSSKSFWNEGAWTPIKNALRAGDYVIVQFGHNDEKSDSALHTEPYTTYQEYLSRYIDDTVAKGATPILATSICRNNWSGSTVTNSHGEYPAAMLDLAKKKKVSVVDATAHTKAYFERIGQVATTKLFLNLAAGEYPNYPSGNTDNTHLHERGARIVGQMILADLYRQSLPPGTLAKTVPVPP